ncbi:MAG TPA: ATP-binding protein [Steroidobacteraceae bacterium]|jgi:signal transduction histidine kinase/ActR/RegA family two-component response regulator|nr:ATP-binding protein [Steroidobacteraceae bacterium]
MAPLEDSAAMRSQPIQWVLMRIILLSGLAVLVVTVGAFSTYELLAFRSASVEQLRTLSTVIASNSTAALAFDDSRQAATVLAALQAEPHIRAAALYDAQGRLFATWPAQLPPAKLPRQPGPRGYHFQQGMLVGFQEVRQGTQPLGMLYVQSDLGALYSRAILYGLIVLGLLAVSLPMAYLLSRRLRNQIAEPITALVDIARAVSERQDYSVRAAPTGAREFDLFISSFNEMMTRIQESEKRLQEQLGRLGLLQHITRAVGERQDLPSIFQVVLGTLEENLRVDFGCFLLYDAAARELTVSTIGAASRGLAAALALDERQSVPIDANGLSRCVAGHLVHEPDVQQVPFPFPSRLAGAGLRSLVIAPLAVENQVFGVLACARREAHSFSSGECEFLRQLSEHVALASHQARLYGALQQAYDDLRQSQQAVMQQERLRALGQMASGIAHDINNAISPVSLYTESLLEREPGLSERARGYLSTIQRAIEDVARTVSRMREFYRDREAQLTLERVDLNRAGRQVLELTRPRWNDQAQQRGVMLDLQTELAEALPDIMGAEHEIRDALTNLIFNAVDAMPSGGTLSLRTRSLTDAEGDPRVIIEVADSGVGMDEETRRRCLEPFYTTKGERGTGLGLAMVYGMVQRHSAELDIDSTPGRGTTVRMSFPAQTAALLPIGRAPAASVLTQRLRILLVDDDPLLIKSLQDTLQEDGHLITVTHGGQAGIDTFAAALKRGEPFDIVVTDLGMPHVDGRKVAASIRALSGSTPIILLTGWGQRMIAANDIPPHVSKVLAKPPRLNELRAALAELA